MAGKSAAARAARERTRRRSGYSTSGIYSRAKRPEYPDCTGMHETCPKIIEDLKNPPEHCRICPTFRESIYYRKEFDENKLKSFHDLFSSIKKGLEENMPKEISENKSENCQEKRD